MFIVCVNNIFIDMFVGVMDVGKQRQVMGAQKGKWRGQKMARGRGKNGKWWGKKRQVVGPKKDKWWGQKMGSGGDNKGQVVGAKKDKWWR